MYFNVVRTSLEKIKEPHAVSGWYYQSISDGRVVGANDLISLFRWIDAAYVLYNNIRSQMSGVIHGALHVRSSKQKINTRRILWRRKSRA